MRHDAADPGPWLQSLLRAAALVETRLEEAVAPTGLSLAKLGVLQHLADAGEPLPLGQLADRIACVKSNVTQLVDRLEADGLVRRETDPADRRVVRAALTAEGRARCEDGARARRAAELELARTVAPELRGALARFLDGLEGRAAARH